MFAIDAPWPFQHAKLQPFMCTWRSLTLYKCTILTISVCTWCFLALQCATLKNMHKVLLGPFRMLPFKSITHALNARRTFWCAILMQWCAHPSGVALLPTVSLIRHHVPSQSTWWIHFWYMRCTTQGRVCKLTILPKQHLHSKILMCYSCISVYYWASNFNWTLRLLLWSYYIPLAMWGPLPPLHS